MSQFGINEDAADYPEAFDAQPENIILPDSVSGQTDISRRRFLQLTAATGAATLASPFLSSAEGAEMQGGIKMEIPERDPRKHLMHNEKAAFAPTRFVQKEITLTNSFIPNKDGNRVIAVPMPDTAWDQKNNGGTLYIYKDGQPLSASDFSVHTTLAESSEDKKYVNPVAFVELDVKRHGKYDIHGVYDMVMPDFDMTWFQNMAKLNTRMQQLTALGRQNRLDRAGYAEYLQLQQSAKQVTAADRERFLQMQQSMQAGNAAIQQFPGLSNIAGTASQATLPNGKVDCGPRANKAASMSKQIEVIHGLYWVNNHGAATWHNHAFNVLHDRRSDKVFFGDMQTANFHPQSDFLVTMVHPGKGNYSAEYKGRKRSVLSSYHRGRMIVGDTNTEMYPRKGVDNDVGRMTRITVRDSNVNRNDTADAFIRNRLASK